MKEMEALLEAHNEIQEKMIQRLNLSIEKIQTELKQARR